jgi:exodeoxyribonuclease VII large subunit
MTDEPKRKIYTLLDITKSLQSVIRKTYTHSYWIKAEIARLNHYPKSGHCYPDLVHKEAGKVQAGMRAIIWRDDFRVINNKFKETIREELKDGMQILFRASISFHPNHGLSLQILDVEPSFTLGEMAREKAETIQRLKKEGVFDKNRRLPYPILPKRIAVVSVQTSKGYHDFLNIIEKNRYGYRFIHYLFPALLQGDKAAQSIIGQLRVIYKARQYFDVVAIIRGGGGDVGLNSYDDYELARAVAIFPLPVLTGIGHSTNETVTEMVAHANKITPTDLAYSLVEAFHNQDEIISQLGSRLSNRVRESLAKERQQLEYLARRPQQSLKYHFSSNREIVNRLSDRIHQRSEQILTHEHHHLQYLMKQAHRDLEHALKNQFLHLQQQTTKISQLQQQHLRNAVVKLDALANKVDLLHPRHVLERGYSLTLKDGKSVKDTIHLKTGDKVTTLLAQGKFESEIKKIHHD